MPGYDVKVVEPLKTSLICPECNLLLRDAVQTCDGVCLCESCCKQILEYPNCTSPKVTIGKEYYIDKAIQKEISQLLVLCLHVIYGCPWQGKLQHFEDHCKDCKYKPVKCPNPGCSELMPAEKLDSHVNEDCPFKKVACVETTASQLDVSHEFLSDVHEIIRMELQLIVDHLNLCHRHKVPLECGRCPERVARDAVFTTTDCAREFHPASQDLNQLTQRTQVYPSSPIQASTSCNLSEVQCFQPSFGPFMEHKYSGLPNTFREVDNQVNVRVLQNGSYVWRIPNVSQCRQSAAAVRSPQFFTAQTGYKMCIEAYLHGDGVGHSTYFSLSFILMKGDYDALLTWPFLHKVTFVLIDQTHYRHKVVHFQPDHSNPSFQRPQFDSNIPYDIPHFTELSVLDDARYVKEDVMFIKCMIDTMNIFHP